MKGQARIKVIEYARKADVSHSELLCVPFFLSEQISNQKSMFSFNAGFSSHVPK